jgi:hypothetical protein
MTPNENRTGLEAEIGQDNYFKNTEEKRTVTDKEIKHS